MDAKYENIAGDKLFLSEMLLENGKSVIYYNKTQQMVYASRRNMTIKDSENLISDFLEGKNIVKMYNLERKKNTSNIVLYALLTVICSVAIYESSFEPLWTSIVIIVYILMSLSFFKVWKQ